MTLQREASSPALFKDQKQSLESITGASVSTINDVPSRSKEIEPHHETLRAPHGVDE
jgi:hypothetical protein